MVDYAKYAERPNKEILMFLKVLPSDVHIYICTGYTDMRKSIDGLADIVDGEFGFNSRAKSLFCFCGRRVNTIKIIFWDGDGYLLSLKKLESGRMRWPRKERQLWRLTHSGLYHLFTSKQFPEDGDVLRTFPSLNSD